MSLVSCFYLLQCENTFTSELEQGDRAKAMKRLRVPPLGEAQSPWTTFKVGLFSGALIVLLVVILISGKCIVEIFFFY